MTALVALALALVVLAVVLPVLWRLKPDKLRVLVKLWPPQFELESETRPPGGS